MWWSQWYESPKRQSDVLKKCVHCWLNFSVYRCFCFQVVWFGLLIDHCWIRWWVNMTFVFLKYEFYTDEIFVCELATVHMHLVKCHSFDRTPSQVVVTSMTSTASLAVWQLHSDNVTTNSFVYVWSIYSISAGMPRSTASKSDSGKCKWNHHIEFITFAWTPLYWLSFSAAEEKYLSLYMMKAVVSESRHVCVLHLVMCH